MNNRCEKCNEKICQGHGAMDVNKPDFEVIVAPNQVHFTFNCLHI